MHTTSFTVTTPITAGLDVEALRWYTRESFEKLAESRNVEIVEYSETEVPAEDIPAPTRKTYPDAKWMRFDAVAKYPDDIQEILNQLKGG